MGEGKSFYQLGGGIPSEFLGVTKKILPGEVSKVKVNDRTHTKSVDRVSEKLS